MLKLATKIKIEMLKAGVSGAEIARKVRTHRTNIYHVIEGRSRSARIRMAICEATGLPMSIWDEIDRPEKAA